MPRYRLRYRGSNLVIPPNGFLVGRSPDCDLELDDASVSRLHARFVLRDGGLVVEDLGSRNGIRVNGERIDSESPVKKGDSVEIGSHHIEVLAATETKRPPANTLELWICQRCRSPKPGEHAACPRCGATDSDSESDATPGGHASPTVRAPAVDFLRTTRPSSLPPAPRRSSSPSDLATGRPRRDSRFPAAAASEPSGGFHVVTDLALKSLALGRFGEAEKMLNAYLEGLHQRSVEELDEEQVAQACRLALQLAMGLKSERWIDYVFAIYGRLRAVPPEEIVDSLYQVMGPVRYRNVRALRDYLESIGELELAAGARFRKRRLEGLMPMIGA